MEKCSNTYVWEIGYLINELKVKNLPTKKEVLLPVFTTIKEMDITATKRYVQNVQFNK